MDHIEAVATIHRMTMNSDYTRLTLIIIEIRIDILEIRVFVIIVMVMLVYTLKLIGSSSKVTTRYLQQIIILKHC